VVVHTMATKCDRKKTYTKNEKISDLIGGESDIDNFEPNLSTPQNSTFGSPKNERTLAN
jgi:hypothetical protein